MSRYLTVPEVAERLRRSTDQIYSDVREGRLPCLRVHPRGRILFDEGQLERALAGHASASATSGLSVFDPQNDDAA